MEARPTIKIRLTKADKIIEILCLLILTGFWVWIRATYSNLPSRIPTHFNGQGQVDNYGDKSTILILPAIATVIFIAMTFLNKYPHIYNYPSSITAANAERQYTSATRLIRFLKLAVVFIFLMITAITYLVVYNKATGLGLWFLPVSLALLLIPSLFFIFSSFKLKK